jgi:hypothetical protein
MNRLEAREILLHTGLRRIYLIRFSRTEPQNLVITYINSRGEIGNRLNQMALNEKSEAAVVSVPIEKILNEMFQEYEPIQMQLNLKQVLAQQNMISYATQSRGYAS